MNRNEDVVAVDEVGQVIDQACCVLAHLCRAPAAVVFAARGKTMRTVGSHGVRLPQRLPLWRPRQSGPPLEPLAVLKNLSKDATLQGHPLIRALPFARHAIHIRFKENEAGEAASIVIVDPTVTLSPKLAACLLEAASLIELLLTLHHRGRVNNDLVQAGSFPVPGDTSAVGSVVSFLDETLVRARRLKTRHDLSYLTLRSWRTHLKPYQIKALRALKLDPPESLVELAAGEMFDVMATLVGEARFDRVVAVPCSHSPPEVCLSQKIAERLAARMGTHCVSGLSTQRRHGSSHPRKNVALPPLQIAGELSGRCILVDDVATTGTHIYQAANTLKQSGAEVVALAWIG